MRKLCKTWARKQNQWPEDKGNQTPQFTDQNVGEKQTKQTKTKEDSTDVKSPSSGTDDEVKDKQEQPDVESGVEKDHEVEEKNSHENIEIAVSVAETAEQKAVTINSETQTDTYDQDTASEAGTLESMSECSSSLTSVAVSLSDISQTTSEAESLSDTSQTDSDTDTDTDQIRRRTNPKKVTTRHTYGTNKAVSQLVPKKVAAKKKDVCKYLRRGYCKYGRRGEECPDRHPKLCHYYMRDPASCRHSEQCRYMHPVLCRYSVEKGECLNEKCTLYHLKGTNRRGTKNHNEATQKFKNPHAGQEQHPRQDPQAHEQNRNIRRQVNSRRPSYAEMLTGEATSTIRNEQVFFEQLQAMQNQLNIVMKAMPWAIQAPHIQQTQQPHQMVMQMPTIVPTPIMRPTSPMCMN
ncbi:hypothetical protein SNEBB_010064 [Seison nebaliae]|nr:hypothetical protein SNEBB_010064 [Seison nebaliae]